MSGARKLCDTIEGNVINKRRCIMGILDFFKKGSKEKVQPVSDTSEQGNNGVGRILFQTRWKGSALFAENSLIQKVASFRKIRSANRSEVLMMKQLLGLSGGSMNTNKSQR